MEVVVTTEAIRRAKLQSNHHHQQTNTQYFTGRMPFLSPNQQWQSTEGKDIPRWKTNKLRTTTVLYYFPLLFNQPIFVEITPHSLRQIDCHVHLHSLGAARVPMWTTCCSTLQSSFPSYRGRASGWLRGWSCVVYGLTYFVLKAVFHFWIPGSTIFSVLKKTWLDFVKNDMESLGLSQKDAQSRNKWRRIKGAAGQPRFTWKNGR